MTSPFFSQAFFKQNNVPQESRFNLKKNVEEEYRKWKSMANENDIITHFSMQGSPPLFLCLLWKMLLETDHINQTGFRSVPPFCVSTEQMQSMQNCFNCIQSV